MSIISAITSNPWEIPTSLPQRAARRVRKLLGRNKRLRIGTDVMEVPDEMAPDDMAWAFFTNREYYEKTLHTGSKCS